MNARALGQGGFVLVCVLWILAVLTCITLGFAHRAVLDERAAALTLDHARASSLARGATERGIAALRNRYALWRTTRRTGAPPPLELWPKPPNLLAEGECFASPEAGADTCSYTIQDEERRISINTASEEFLENIKALGFRTVSEIIDRRGDDPDRPNRQGFWNIDELRTLKGVSDRDWQGGRDAPGLKDILTVWGDGRININTASREVLECIPDVDPSVVSAVLAYRQGPDGELNTADDRTFDKDRFIPVNLDMSPEKLEPLMRCCKTQSSFFTITGYATQRQGKVRAACRAVVKLRGSMVTVLDWQEANVGS